MSMQKFGLLVLAMGGIVGVWADDASLKKSLYPGTVREWLVSGPWPSYLGERQGKGLETDFLDTEADAAPAPGAKARATFIADKAKLIAGIGSANEWGFTETKTFDASWRKMSARDGIVWLDGVFKPIDDHFAAYACCYVEAAQEMDARLAVGSDDDHKIWLDRREVGQRATSQAVTPGAFKYDVHLTPGVHRILLKVVDRTNDCGFTLAVTDRADQAIPGLKAFIDPRGRKLVLDAQKAAAHSPERLTRENAALERERAELKGRLPELERRAAALRTKLAAARCALEETYADVERRYAKLHADAAAKGVKGVDAPVPSVPDGLRRRLCINGVWELSGDDGRTWEKRPVPTPIIDRYFAAGTWPVARTRPDTPWCAYTNCTGFVDFNVSETLFRDHVKFRTTFDWDGRGRPQFVCEGIVGVCAFFCNGTRCGDYDGRVGIVTVPLAGAVKGRNTLEIDFRWLWAQTHHNTDGLLGDLYIDYVGDVRVADVYAKPSWCRAALAAEIELANDRDQPVTATVRAQVVKNGRAKLFLPPVEVSVPAKGKTTVETSSGWGDPQLWGIGGTYGDPELYDLVTDVQVKGVTVDRHVQRFGFREFWIRHTDFFLNGRRIILQGDTGHPGISTGRGRDIFWPLLRADGINTVRYHDSEFWSVNAARGADRMGMLCLLQMYPQLHARDLKKPGPGSFAPFAGWERTPEHAWNLANYERWFRAFRNSPSAVVWSTDNEIFTQAWDTSEKADFNVRNDKVGALYEKFMKRLDPRLVLTRDGDVGTWGTRGRWREEPPCDTANYHYPDFNVDAWVRDWQEVYDWRPAVFGETLYVSYGAWDKWIGAIPSQVEMKARRVREVASLYRELGVPGQIYMGLSGDGFIGRDDTGKGNPQGITEQAFQKWRKTGRRPAGQAADQFPWFRIPWPALSGREGRPIARSVIGHNWTYGHDAVNFYDARYPSHVRNRVNDAYRASLLPQPALRVGADAEVVVVAAPGAEVWATSPEGARTEGVRADAEGRAWFRFLDPGAWRFQSGAARVTVDLAPRGAGVAKPGFEGVRTVRLEEAGEVRK